MIPIRLKKEKKPSKYLNKKTEVNGIRFDSKAEAACYLRLLAREQRGEISSLERQVKLELVPRAKLYGSKVTRPAILVIVDFRFTEAGETMWLDTKGMETPVSKIKRHLAKALHGIDIRTTQ